MRRFYFIGTYNKDKFWFICYFAKLLSVNQRVLVITNYCLFNGDVEPLEIAMNLDVIKADSYKKDLSSEYEFVLFDIFDENQHIEEDSVLIFMTSGYKKQLLKNRGVIKSYEDQLLIDGNQWKCYLILYDLLLDSKINVKFLQHLLFQRLDEEKYEYISIPFNEWDMGIHMENEYEEKVNLKRLSKGYKEALKEILIGEKIVSIKEFKKIYHKAERGA
jgi:hypothetical protein